MIVVGEAKRKAGSPPSVVYHHTSQIRTNLIWMSGRIELEGRSKGALHPLFGEINTDASMRRPCVDFPPLAWFTRSTSIPQCLLKAEMVAVSKSDGSAIDFERETGMGRQQIANGIALKRFALGFKNDPAIFQPWKDHFGYATAEGSALNESARAAGDNPDLWYVADQPVDVLTCTEVWASRSIFKPRLEPFPQYLPEIQRMVRLCRDNPGAHIPPSWLGDPAVEPMVRARQERHFRSGLNALAPSLHI